MMEFSAQSVPGIIENYGNELKKELIAILRFWKDFTVDIGNGGFYGAVSNDCIPDKKAAKGIVLNSRILWTFSAASLSGIKGFEALSDRAYQFICEAFADQDFGGVYWSVDANGTPKDTKKQIYGIAFCIYGLSEYYRLTRKQEALSLAIELYHCIEKYSFDEKNNGYVEAFSREWHDLGDVRLSDKDANEKFTMNTHLHIIEAYANLYHSWRNETLKNRIRNLLAIFHQKIIDKRSGHLHLFMNETWRVQSDSYSFGHDIEASWLLQECAQIIDDASYTNLFQKQAIKLAEAASEGLADDGALYHEIKYHNGTILKEKHWWPQAEAMVGFFHAWQISHDIAWLQKSINTWKFVKNRLRDDINGEWFWGINERGELMNENKAGFWKCPYHNSRACMELIKRIELSQKL